MVMCPVLEVLFVIFTKLCSTHDTCG